MRLTTKPERNKEDFGQFASYIGAKSKAMMWILNSSLLFPVLACFLYTTRDPQKKRTPTGRMIGLMIA
jgi:hypothetical protein